MNSEKINIQKSGFRRAISLGLQTVAGTCLLAINAIGRTQVEQHVAQGTHGSIDLGTALASNYAGDAAALVLSTVAVSAAGGILKKGLDKIGLNSISKFATDKYAYPAVTAVYMCEELIQMFNSNTADPIDFALYGLLGAYLYKLNRADK